VYNCKSEKPDFLLLGSARTVFSSDILGGILKRIMPEVGCDVLVFNERNFSDIQSVLIIYTDNGDDYLFSYAGLLNHVTGRKFYAVQPAAANESAPVPPNHQGLPIVTISVGMLKPSFLRSVDLVLVAEASWKTLEEVYNLPVKHFQSVLIIHRGGNGNRFLMP
jgi:hypothetical protein